MKELVVISRAIELLHYGVDITKLDSIMNQYYNPKSKSLQSRISDNIVDFRIHYSDKVMEFMDNCLGSNVIRANTSYIEVFDDSLAPTEKELTTVEVDIKEFKQVMVILKEKGWARFPALEPSDYDEEYLKKLEEIRKSFDYTSTPDCDMVKTLTKDKTRKNLEVLLQLSRYSKENCINMLKAFDKDEDNFGLKSLENFPIVDNRMYIKLSPYDKDELKRFYQRGGIPFTRDLEDLEYVVISRNPYDFYFCSYGSNIQSCYSLNSGHYGWYGFVPLSQFDGTFIIYGTSGKSNKINLLNGIKWHVPRMLYRSWGWKTTDGQLMLDRVYIGEDAAERVRNVINKWFEKMFLHYGIDFTTQPMDKELVSSEKYVEYFQRDKMKFYPDSINFETNGGTCHYRGICKGDRKFVGAIMPLSTSLLNTMRTITSIDEKFHLCDKYMVLNGVLKSVKSCPITGLPICDEDEKSEYARFFKNPVSNVAVVTYIDGFYHLDMASKARSTSDKIQYEAGDTDFASARGEGGRFCFTKRFCGLSNTLNIKSFKEMMTAMIKECEDIEAVIVRFIEGDKVYYVKYGRK